jgi:hypothetical protein
MNRVAGDVVPSSAPPERREYRIRNAYLRRLINVTRLAARRIPDHGRGVYVEMPTAIMATKEITNNGAVQLRIMPASVAVTIDHRCLRLRAVRSLACCRK